MITWTLQNLRVVKVRFKASLQGAGNLSCELMNHYADFLRLESFLQQCLNSHFYLSIVYSNSPSFPSSVLTWRCALMYVSHCFSDMVTYRMYWVIHFFVIFSGQLKKTCRVGELNILAKTVTITPWTVATNRFF